MDWWTPQMAGLIGGGAGALLGILGAALGVSAGLLLPKGKGKPLVVALGTTIIALGLVCLGLGVVALIVGQPYHVWYPPLLIGVIATFVGGLNLPLLMARYRQAEARRLDAEQLRRA